MSKEAERYGYDKDAFSALDAITEAQRIAFAPMIFQATVILRDSGILSVLDKAGKTGCLCDEVVAQVELDSYAVQLLLDVGLSARLVYQQEERFLLSKVGYYVLHDRMTRVNTDFTMHVCYQGLFHLKDAFEKSAPSGLKVFGDWPTIYPALSQLPEKASQSWFDFDHFYSDAAFNAAFNHVMALKPQHIYDVGGNTGKWALHCVQHHADVTVTILDLPEQLALARKNIIQAGYDERIKSHEVDLLKADSLPNQADVWWMSQFLDCFSEEQIVHILTLINCSIKPNAKIAILEIFWDRQPFEAGALSLNASSLYFTCMANGNSRFYHSKVFYSCLRKAGFYVEQDIDGLGLGHTLLVCRKL